jgi:hypothetical protein
VISGLVWVEERTYTDRSMIFADSAIEAIARAWQTDQEDPRKNRAARSIPKLEALSYLIEQAFQASLKRVEERPVRFAFAVLPLNEADRTSSLRGRRSEVLALDPLVRFTSDSLAKLGTACDPSLGCLLVDASAETADASMIWGSAFYEPSGIAFGESVRSGLPCSIGFEAWRPDVLVVSSVVPGSLEISRGDVRIGEFAMGEFRPALPTPLSPRAMGEQIAARVRGSGGDSAYEAWYLREYVRWLEYLLAEIGRRGHGGTAIFCPEAAWDRIGLQCQGGYRISGDLSLSQIIRTRYRAELALRQAKDIGAVSSELVDIARCGEHMRNRLAFVAQLATSDGALVVCEDFRPLAYATMLPAGDWPGPVIAGPDGYGHGGGVYDLLRHGMRHRSAAAFVGTHRELLGFVVSQDGPVRGFARGKGEALLVWSDCRSSVFA